MALPSLREPPNSTAEFWCWLTQRSKTQANIPNKQNSTAAWETTPPPPHFEHAWPAAGVSHCHLSQLLLTDCVFSVAWPKRQLRPIAALCCACSCQQALGPSLKTVYMRRTIQTTPSALLDQSPVPPPTFSTVRGGGRWRNRGNGLALGKEGLGMPLSVDDGKHKKGHLGPSVHSMFSKQHMDRVSLHFFLTHRLPPLYPKCESQGKPTAMLVCVCVRDSQNRRLWWLILRGHNILSGVRLHFLRTPVLTKTT